LPQYLEDFVTSFQKSIHPLCHIAPILDLAYYNSSKLDEAKLLPSSIYQYLGNHLFGSRSLGLCSASFVQSPIQQSSMDLALDHPDFQSSSVQP
jgi:hypothetical protein